MKTIIELMPYSEEFINNCSTGWGCGYVKIPVSHPFYVKRLLSNDDYFYPQINGFSEEITFAEVEGNYLKIGFDTAHIYNNMQNSGKDFVEQKANELKSFVDAYNMEDAKKEVEHYLGAVKQRFEKFL